jgi:hypothetical protein
MISVLQKMFDFRAEILVSDIHELRTKFGF